jgi:lipase
MEESLWKKERVPGEVELAICCAGRGPEPVVCLHGITAQHRAFNAAARYLETSRGLVGVDLRGRGDSDKPESGYSLEAHAADVVRVLDHLGLQSAVLAGHSMGAFVALKTALMFPERVRALVLLDGGWPRVESSPREMTFESPEAYLDFWFPDQNLKMEDLPPDLADYYLYDLGEVENGYNPKASRVAAEEDSPSVSSTSPTAEEMRGVACPVALVRASQGFFPGSDPLISDETRDVMAESLDIRTEILLEGANHYTMLWPEYTRVWADKVFNPPFWER